MSNPYRDPVCFDNAGFKNASRKILDAFHRYHRAEFLETDPVEFVHRYRNPLDQEVVALIAALLAYGNVKQIRRSVAEVLRRMSESGEGSPSQFVKAIERGARGARPVLQGFVHRFTKGEEIAALLSALGRSWRDHGSLAGHFEVYHLERAPHLGPGLSGLIAEWRSRDPILRDSYLLTSPADGSCCKRWCMLMRWLARKDDLDPGPWAGRKLHPRQLVIPLDTHVGRIARSLQLTQRKTMDWKAALEVTEALKRLDSEDPVKFDFALMRVGLFEKRSRES